MGYCSITDKRADLSYSWHSPGALRLLEELSAKMAKESFFIYFF